MDHVNMINDDLLSKYFSGEIENTLIMNHISSLGYLKIGPLGGTVTCTADRSMATRLVLCRCVKKDIEIYKKKAGYINEGRY